MGVPNTKAVHYFDMEFNNELRKLFVEVFPSYEKQLKEAGLVKNSLADYTDAGEACFEVPSSLADYFFMKSQGALRYFLIKDLSYKCYGTQVWLQLPTSKDVSAWFDSILQ